MTTWIIYETSRSPSIGIVGFQEAEYSVGEGDGQVTICVEVFDVLNPEFFFFGVQVITSSNSTMATATGR